MIATMSLHIANFDGRRRHEVLATLGALLLLILLVVSAFIDLSVMLLVAVATILVAFHIRRLHTRRPELLKIRMERLSFNKLIAASGVTEADLDAVESEFKKQALFDKKFRERVRVDHHKLTDELNHELARIEKEFHEKKNLIDQDATSLSARQADALAESFWPLQKAWVLQHLAFYRIKGAYIRHLNSANVDALAKRKIRTAADFVGVQIVGRSDPKVSIVNRAGDLVRIRGIGPQKARALEEWRQQCESRARSICPIAVPEDLHREVGERFHAQWEALRERRAILEDELQEARTRARDAVAAKRASFSGEVQVVLDDSQQKLAELARRETELRGMIADRVTVQRWAAALNRREKSLDLWHYVYFSLFGR
ncbi:hypothetical protein ACFQES_24005 [Nonomuraea salmonea]|uniref:hypothetical protein n=1 Tax=Nonomuraea salmonea TaxID=46181 RepID=UPI00361DF7C7